MSPGALSEPDGDQRAAPPSGPCLSREPEGRLPELEIGWRSQPEQERGCRTRVWGVLRPEVVYRRRAPSISSPPRAGVRAFSHTQSPLLGVGLNPSTALHCAGPDAAMPCARLAPPPALSAGYFYPLLAGRCFWGDSGEATPNPLFSPCAPRSCPLLAGSGSKKWTKNWGWRFTILLLP
uniref:Uncharacterized protein n=1 Tax=Ailuropoda melanoleuca TaxID=9646 RepID=A0A7N5P1J1_AILME